MKVEFDVKMTNNAMYDFMLHTNYTSVSGIMGIILGGITLFLGILNIIEGNNTTGATFLVIALVFLVANPVNMKARAGAQVKTTPMFQKPIHYTLTEEGVEIAQDDQHTVVKWSDFQKAVSTNKSVILYVTKIRAMIFPKESLGEEYLAAVKMISTHMPPKKVKIRHVSAS